MIAPHPSLLRDAPAVAEGGSVTRRPAGGSMATYVVLYKFTAEGQKSIRDSIKRAGRIRQQNARLGFTIQQVFWLQGQYDMIAIVDAPSEEAMMGAMLNVVSAGNVS